MGRERSDWRPGPRDEQDGIRVRETGKGPRVEIDFRYRGVRCRERLNFELTPGNWRYAARLRAEVLNAIERGTFKYGDYFPDSKRAAVFGQSTTKDLIEDVLRDFLAECELAIQRGNMSPSTLEGYRKVIVGDLIPEFGRVRAAEFNGGHVRQWVMKQDCTAKTIRNKLSPLRCALDAAVVDNRLPANPIAEAAIKKTIDKVKRPSDFDVDPFSPEERAAFLAACAGDEERDMYEFWFETGLRPGELIALEWSRIDLNGRTAHIDRNFVSKTEKAPKTDAGVRDMELTAIALAALKRQRERTSLAGGRVWRCTRFLQVIGRRRATELGPWMGAEQIRKTSYTPIMRKAGIRWRSMYQIRHTFASTHASAGTNLFWLAGQLGHKTIDVLIKHYARWIPSGGIGPGSTVNLANHQIEDAQTGRAQVIPLSRKRM